MFQKREVVAATWAPEKQGVIRVRYRGHYLVSFPSERHRRIRHLTEKQLISVSSPQYPKYLELRKRYKKLEQELEKIEKEIGW